MRWTGGLGGSAPGCPDRGHLESVDLGADRSLEGVRHGGHSRRRCKEIRREWSRGGLGKEPAKEKLYQYL